MLSSIDFKINMWLKAELLWLKWGCGQSLIKIRARKWSFLKEKKEMHTFGF